MKKAKIIKNKALYKSKPRVFVAMSGGVDSSVTAALLKQKGYDVVGVYMKNWSGKIFPKKFSKNCPWKKDLRDVKKVCIKIGIPFKVYDFEKEYVKRVIDYFFDEEIKGKTPNPDIMCNREIKFGLFLKKAHKGGADYVATGHYVKKSKSSTDSHSKNFTRPNPAVAGLRRARKSKIRFKLSMAKDKTKDQSYFLCLLTQKQIEKSLFPLGNYIKIEVRKIAKKLKLPTAERPESMGICFVGEVNIKDFLKTRIKEKPGDIITTEGEIVGRHQGLPFYTIGQRKGIELSGGPYYVAEKDLKNNRLIVTNNPYHKALFKKEIKVKNINWIEGVPPKFPFSCSSRIRYQQSLQRAVVRKEKGKVIVKFQESQRAVTSGQFCVFYKRNEMLGGGVIC